MPASATDPHIGLVVEGPGDARAVPILLRAHLCATGEYRDVLGKPIGCNGREKAIAKSGIEGFVAAAAARPGCSGILIVLDSEGDPVCERGPELLTRARRVSTIPVSIALADRCFEDWLFASAESLGLDGLAYNPQARGNGAIVQALRPAKYVKPTWQPRLASRLNLPLAASRSASLRRMLERFDGLREALPAHQ